jgi:PAS domain S-box-containing protein
MGDSKSLKLTDLVSLRTLQRLQDNFSQALGISAHILDLDAEPITKSYYNSSFLAKICSTDQKALLKAIHRDKPYIYECKGRLFSFAVPILVQGKAIALIKGGQVRLGNPNLKECKQLATEFNVDFDDYLEAYLSLPFFTKERLLASANLLKLVSSTISSMAFLGISAEEEIQQVTYINDLLEQEVRRKTWDLERANKRYRMLIENAEDIIYTVDSAGILTSINSAVLRIAGYDPSEVIGESFSSFIQSDYLDLLSESFVEIVKGNKSGTAGLEFQILHKNGGVRWVELNSRAVRDKKGEFIEIEGVLRDITRSHEERGVLDVQFKEFFDASLDALFLIDDNGKCLDMNESLLQLLGYSELGQVDDLFFLNFVPLEFRSEYIEVARAFMGNKKLKSTQIEIVFLSQEGTHVPTKGTLTRLNKGHCFGMVLSVENESVDQVDKVKSKKIEKE